MMGNRFFPKKDEVILSTVMMIIVGGLIYQGVFALCHSSTHAIFQKKVSDNVKH